MEEESGKLSKKTSIFDSAPWNVDKNVKIKSQISVTKNKSENIKIIKSEKTDKCSTEWSPSLKYIFIYI